MSDTHIIPVKRRGTPKRYIASVTVASLLLLLASSAFWINRYLFDTANFTRVTTSAIETESSRKALASGIVDRALQDRPMLKNIVDDPAIKLLSGLLDTNVARKALDRAVSRLQVLATSSNPQNVVIDLSSLKQVLSTVLTAAGSVANVQTSQASVRVEDIPESITLVDVSKLPNTYWLEVTVLWVGPLALVAAIILLAYPLWRAPGKRSKIKLLVIAGISVLGAWMIGQLLPAMGKPLALGSTTDQHVRTVIENIYTAFATTFTQQNYVLFGLAVALLLTAGVVYLATARRMHQSHLQPTLSSKERSNMV